MDVLRLIQDRLARHRRLPLDAERDRLLRQHPRQAGVSRPRRPMARVRGVRLRACARDSPRAWQRSTVEKAEPAEVRASLDGLGLSTKQAADCRGTSRPQTGARGQIPRPRTRLCRADAGARRGSRGRRVHEARHRRHQGADPQAYASYQTRRRTTCSVGRTFSVAQGDRGYARAARATATGLPGRSPFRAFFSSQNLPRQHEM